MTRQPLLKTTALFTNPSDVSQSSVKVISIICHFQRERLIAYNEWQYNGVKALTLYQDLELSNTK